MNTQKLIGKVEKFVLFGIFNQHYNNKWHYLREMNMLNDEEEKTIEGKTTREDKARCLIDTVMEKGERASSLMVDYLTKRQPELRICELFLKVFYIIPGFHFQGLVGISHSVADRRVLV